LRLSKAATDILLIRGIGAGLWIKHWSDLNDSYGGNYQAGKYLGIYTAIGVVVCIFGCTESIICSVVCGIAASKSLHDRMAQAIFRAPMSFFETTPAGQITNRFSTDINAIDGNLIYPFVRYVKMAGSRSVDSIGMANHHQFLH